jgi:futalosine hydrolase
MPLRILYITATSAEAEAIEIINSEQAIRGRLNELETNILVAGVGSISTAWAMQKWISVNERPDLAVNLGIAGSYREDIKTGDVVMPMSDCFADAGIEDGNDFLTLSEAGLTGANDFPFTCGLILADPVTAEKAGNIVKRVKAITVNTATGTDITRDRLVKKYNPDIETMEGATFFYICTRERIPFLALRAISNKVEHRDKTKWDIPLALRNLSEKLGEVIIMLK